MRPVVIAHRTCPHHAPENSLAGISAAAVLGADYVEVDVRRTRDGMPVLLHDPLLFRTAWPPLPVPVGWLRAATVTRWRLRGGSGARIPTLADALAALPVGLGAAIDTKERGAAPATLAAVQAAGAEERVLLWSQHEPAVRYYAEHAPDVDVALLRDALDPDEVERLLADAVAFGANAISVPDITGTAELVERAAERGLGVFVWYRTWLAQYEATVIPVRGVVTDWVAEAHQTLL